jgi:hypothetical protein
VVESDLYDVVISNNSSSAVSGTISVTDDTDYAFVVNPHASKTIGVPAPYTVAYQNQYWRITGRIDYSSNTVTFVDNPGLELILTSNIDEDVWVRTGGYIGGEDASYIKGEHGYEFVNEGLKISGSGSFTGRIYMLNPSFTAYINNGIAVSVSWTISWADEKHTVPKNMTGIIHY